MQARGFLLMHSVFICDNVIIRSVAADLAIMNTTIQTNELCDTHHCLIKHKCWKSMVLYCFYCLTSWQVCIPDLVKLIWRGHCTAYKPWYNRSLLLRQIFLLLATHSNVTCLTYSLTGVLHVRVLMWVLTIGTFLAFMVINEQYATPLRQQALYWLMVSWIDKYTMASLSVAPKSVSYRLS